MRRAAALAGLFATLALSACAGTPAQKLCTADAIIQPFAVLGAEIGAAAAPEAAPGVAVGVALDKPVHAQVVADCATLGVAGTPAPSAATPGVTIAPAAQP